MEEKIGRVYFPRPDPGLPEEEQARQMKRCILLWVAEQEEKNGSPERAQEIKAKVEKDYTK